MKSQETPPSKENLVEVAKRLVWNAQTQLNFISGSLYEVPVPGVGEYRDKVIRLAEEAGELFKKLSEIE